MRKQYSRLQKYTAAALTLLLLAAPANAGLTVTRSNGIATTGVDGVTFVNTSGIATTGVDGFLSFAPNGIATTGVDGIATTGVDGIATTGVDGVTYAGSNGIAVTGVDSLNVVRADGIAVTGVDGIAVTGVDGQTYTADSLLLNRPSGIATTGVDGAELRGASGIATTGVDSFTAERADGIATTGVDSLSIQSADGATLFLPNGTILSVAPNGIAVTGVDGISMNAPEGIAVTGVDGIATTGVDGIATTGVDDSTGLQSLDPELALLLDRLTDDSNVNATIIYHRLPNEADIADLLANGVLGGTRYRSLPMVAVTTTKQNLINISRLPSVRAIYGNRTLKLDADPYTELNNAARVPIDADLTSVNQGLPVSGRNVRVAVLDTGVDGTHADLSGRVAQNVKVLDTQSLGVGFLNPVAVENLPNTDQLYGHGTFVAGVIAGSGSRSGAKYAGIAPGAHIVGVSAGDLTLSFVLSGLDYILTNAQALNIRVVNCSFSSNNHFDFNDPVNVATKLLTDRGVNVVFSAGNSGDGLHTLNPYAVAPWVVSVGATDNRGRLASFSSRGSFGSPLFRPTLVAPGVSLIGPRALGVTGILGLLGADTQRLTVGELPYYTTASGTSFSAPQVAGVIALMLEANPNLTPREVRDILQRSATPLPNYYLHEVGAGMLNAHAAVLEAEFADRRTGMWRATLAKGQVSFTNEAPQPLYGSLGLGGVYEKTFTVPENSLMASAQIAWGLTLSVNHLELSVIDPSNNKTVAANDLLQLGITGKRARVLIKNPTPGTWRVRVRNKGLLALTPQKFSGVVELTRAQYATPRDIGSLGATLRSDVYQALRTQAMTPYGQNFRPSFGVARAHLAEAMVVAGRVPQYLAGQPRYVDVRDTVTRNFVESAQFSPATALFPESGGNFRPYEFTDRLTAAIVLVRAAGLRDEAESQSGAPLSSITDLLSIPSNLRGYVTVAVSRGLLPLQSGFFRPSNSLSRADLAQALARIQRLAAE